MDPTKMMSRRFRRYRGGVVVNGVESPAPMAPMAPPVQGEKPGMFSFKMPSFGAQSDNQQLDANSGQKKQGLLGLGVFGMGGARSRRRRTSRRSSRRKSNRRRR
jgi:MYXO-CTERM domain-containing protein